MRNQVLINNLFGINVELVFFIDGESASSKQIKQRLDACLKENKFPKFIYINDIQDNSLSSTLLEFITNQRYSIIGFERISLELLKTIFENLPPTITRIGFDWIISHDSFHIIKNSLTLKKHEGHKIDVVCGEYVLDSKLLTELPNIVPTPAFVPPTSSSSVEVIRTRLSAAKKIKTTDQQSTSEILAKVIARQRSESDELKKELQESRHKKQKRDSQAALSPPVDLAPPLNPSTEPQLLKADAETNSDSLLQFMHTLPIPSSNITMPTFTSTPSIPRPDRSALTQLTIPTSMSLPSQLYPSDTSPYSYANPYAGQLFNPACTTDPRMPIQAISSFPQSVFSRRPPVSSSPSVTTQHFYYGMR